MLKERLKSVSITYYDSDALEISDLLSENKYDYIYISNIIDRIKANNEFLEHSIVLLKNLSNILETNSTLFSYSFHGMNFINIDNGLTSIYDVSETNKNYPKVFSFTKR